MSETYKYIVYSIKNVSLKIFLLNNFNFKKIYKQKGKRN